MKFKDKRLAKINRATIEAKRFLAAAESATGRLTKEGDLFYASKEMAACKRASMDLTRALAELRKP